MYYKRGIYVSSSNSLKCSSRSFHFRRPLGGIYCISWCSFPHIRRKLQLARDRCNHAIMGPRRKSKWIYDTQKGEFTPRTTQETVNYEARRERGYIALILAGETHQAQADHSTPIKYISSHLDREIEAHMWDVNTRTGSYWEGYQRDSTRRSRLVCARRRNHCEFAGPLHSGHSVQTRYSEHFNNEVCSSALCS
jgi:hypothetical protein